MAAEPQRVSFADGFADSSYRLFELDEPVLQQVLKNDGAVSIKGARNDEAVLCTAEKTFLLRLAESSNALLLAPTNRKRKCTEADGGDATEGDGVEVQASVSAHFEILPTAPRTGSLVGLLSKRPYLGTRDASTVNETDARLTLAGLDRAVQASNVELRAALRAARALPVDGKWCVLDSELEIDIINNVLSHCVGQDWPLTAVPTSRCVELCLTGEDGKPVPDFDEVAIRHCLRTHSIQGSEATDFDGWLAAADCAELSLDPNAICRFRARVLLRDCERWPKDRFFEFWSNELPEGLTPDEKHLAGLAVFLPPSESSSGKAADEEGIIIQALALASLSRVPKERFAALFHVKRSWSLAELEPYTRDLVDPSASTTKLVLQHARQVTGHDGSASYVLR